MSIRQSINNPAISVILPSLNVCDYIDECIRSILDQTFKDIEVICVDANSDDGTRDIINEYVSQDSRLMLIDSPIRSYGYQVNQGISHATGNYISIVETDDYIDSNIFTVLYKDAVDNNLDFIKADYNAYCTNDNGERVFSARTNVYDKGLYREIIDPHDYPVLGMSDWYLWTGLYSRDFMEKNDIRLNETKGAAFQDIGFLIQTLQSARRVRYIDDRLYNYCIDRTGASSNTGRDLAFAYGEYSLCDIARVRQYNGEELFYNRMARSLYSAVADMDEMALSDEVSQKQIDWFIGKLRSALDNGYLHLDTLPEWLSDAVADFVESGISCILDYCNKRTEFIKSSVNYPVCIFGCGNYGDRAYNWLIKNNSDIRFYLDNNDSLWGTYINGIPVINPRNVITLGKDMFYVVANNLHSREMYEQLRGYGISDKNIFIIR